MSISFEVAVSTLTAMFPDWDEETLSTLLISNNYHVERTIETVLAMSGDASVDMPQTQQPQPTPMPTPVPTPAPMTYPASPAHAAPQPSNPPSHHHQQQRHRRPSSNGRSVVPPPQQRPGYRGNHCQLPDNFLRVSSLFFFFFFF